MYDWHIYAQVDESNSIKPYKSTADQIIAICQYEDIEPYNIYVGLLDQSSVGYRRDMIDCPCMVIRANGVLDDTASFSDGWRLIAWDQSPSKVDAIMARVLSMFMERV